MEREEADRAGCKILGPAEDVPNGRDVVRVVWDDAAREHSGRWILRQRSRYHRLSDLNWITSRRISELCEKVRYEGES